MKRTHVFRYYDFEGKPAFYKVRYETNDKRGKTFRYFKPDGTPGKPRNADDILYHMPELMRERERDNDVDLFWTEGERDADALCELWRAAISHHQGAGHATEEQAEWLMDWEGQIILVADRDIPGAVDVIRRYDLLRKVGVAEKQLSIVRARKGKDARAHIEAGYGPDDFKELPYRLVKDVADTAVAFDFKRYGYLEWKPQIVEDDEWRLPSLLG